MGGAQLFPWLCLPVKLKNLTKHEHHLISLRFVQVKQTMLPDRKNSHNKSMENVRGAFKVIILKSQQAVATCFFFLVNHVNIVLPAWQSETKFCGILLSSACSPCIGYDQKILYLFSMGLRQIGHRFMVREHSSHVDR